MDRAKWFKVHSWVGFKLSVLLSFILVTGTLAVFSHEIDWLTNSAKRVAPSTVNVINWTAIYKSAREQVPDKDLLHINAPLDPWFSAEVVFEESKGKLHRLFFHPTTGEYLGDGRWYNWQRFFRMTHRHLMMPTKIGIVVVSIFSLFLLVSLVTSMVVYRKWWTGFFRKPRTSHRKFFWGDIHRLFGVWSMWLILVMSVTGIWYLVEVLGLNAKYPSRGEAVTELALQQKVLPEIAVFSLMLETVAKEYPTLELKAIFLPSKAGQGVQFQGQADAVLVRPRANLMSFDPVSAEIIAHNKGEELSLHGRISEAADPLHFGTFAGMTSKVVYFVFGIFLSALSISGAYIYGMRVARIHKEELSPNKKIWNSAFKDMRWGKWLSYVALTICLVLFSLIFTGIVE